MNRKGIILAAFVLMIIAQLYVPAKMIWDNERIWIHGTEHLLKTAPVDPNDIFRGKYIDLAFEATIIQVKDENDWEWGEEVFGVLSTDEEDFSYVSSVKKERPDPNVPYMELTISYASKDGQNEIQVDFPFDRFYMEESKAYEAELSYQKSQQDPGSTTWALVGVLDGSAVIKDVLIDGVPISQIGNTP